MFRRRRPLMRAAVVGGGAYVAGKRVAQRSAEQGQQENEQDERLATLEEQAPAPPAQEAPAATPSIRRQERFCRRLLSRATGKAASEPGFPAIRLCPRSRRLVGLFDRGAGRGVLRYETVPFRWYRSEVDHAGRRGGARRTVAQAGRRA